MSGDDSSQSVEKITSDRTETSVIVSEFSEDTKLKMEVIQSLLSAGDRTTYTQRLKETAEKLGK
jgi:putative transposase